MTRQSHIVIGGLTGYVLGFPVIPAVIGSLMPDVDMYWRKGNSLLTSHRGITHHIILTIFMILLSIIINNSVIDGFIAGYVSHIIADSLTKAGIPYWTNKDRFSLNLFKTGSREEGLTVSFAMVVVAGILFFSHKITVPADITIMQNMFYAMFSSVR